jgi:hypothetical protein
VSHRSWKMAGVAFLLGVSVWGVSGLLGESFFSKHATISLVLGTMVSPGFSLALPIIIAKGGVHSDLPSYIWYVVIPISNGVGYTLIFLFLRWLKERLWALASRRGSQGTSG